MKPQLLLIILFLSLLNLSCALKKSNADTYFEEFLRYEATLGIATEGERNYYILPILGCDVCISENIDKLKKLASDKRDKFSVIFVGKNKNIDLEVASGSMFGYRIIVDSISSANKFQLSLGKPLMIKISKDNECVEYQNVKDADIEKSLNSF
jgi:hypothetical protein